MSELIIHNKIVSTPIIQIIERLRKETNNKYFHQIVNKGNNILVTCPFHKEGKENHPSCNIFNDRFDKDVIYGTVHCFTCNKATSLVYLVAYCLNISADDAEEWIAENFCDIFVERDLELPEISLNKNNRNKYLPFSSLSKYEYYHPYLTEKRHISKEILDKFVIGYDREKDCVTFPVWDLHDNLITVTKRSTKKKDFYIDKDI